MMRAVVAILLLVMVHGCTSKNEDNNILPRDKMQAVMWDIIGADVFTHQFIRKDSLKNASVENMQLQNKVFKLHKVTREDFYKSYDHYLAHADMMKVILDSMSAKAERNRMNMIRQHSGGQPK